jgi:ribokinase
VSKRKPIVVFGSINTDLVSCSERIPSVGETITGTDFSMHPGGKGANQAVAIARLGHPVQLVGRLGNDSFGAELRKYLNNAGVDITAVQTVSGSSGVAVILVSDRGENCIVVTPGANAALQPEDLEEHIDLIRNAALVLTQLETPLATVERLAELCQREAVPLILDPAPAQELPVSLLNAVTWFTPNETEAAFYTQKDLDGKGTQDSEEVVEALLRAGISQLVLKLGERGFHLATADGISEQRPAFTVRAVDTTAAGDAFNGAFATALAMGKSPLESARFAAAAAAISVMRHGAQPSMPTMEEVEAFLQKEAE